MYVELYHPFFWRDIHNPNHYYNRGNSYHIIISGGRILGRIMARGQLMLLSQRTIKELYLTDTNHPRLRRHHACVNIIQDYRRDVSIKKISPSHSYSVPPTIFKNICLYWCPTHCNQYFFELLNKTFTGTLPVPSDGTMSFFLFSQT